MESGECSFMAKTMAWLNLKIIKASAPKEERSYKEVENGL